MMTPMNDNEWEGKLTPEQYEVMRNKGTELPYTGEYLLMRKSGTYCCAGCNTPLFSSAAKYDFGTGWPSFSRPIEEGLLGMEKDTSLGAERTAVFCMQCQGHIGHVFDDGPELKGERRYSVNSCALVFKKDNEHKRRR